MLPLLFPVLADTVIAPPPDFEDIFVNEWGVVVFTSEGTTVAGAPDESGNVHFGREPYGALMVDAPVVWIHGGFFHDAVFTVKASQGELTALYPEPDIVEGDGFNTSASWRISAPPPAPLMERDDPPDPQGVPFAWAMPFWREVPSRDLYSMETDEYLGNFIYYEAGIPFWEPPEMIYDARTLAGYYSPEALVITVGEEPTAELVSIVPLPDGTSRETGDFLNDQEVNEIICGWAAGSLKSQEIEALWNTWKPFFCTETICDRRGLDDETGLPERWILFPLPWDEAERISSIELTMPGTFSGTVSYNRLFLGLARVY